MCSMHVHAHASMQINGLLHDSAQLACKGKESACMRRKQCVWAQSLTKGLASERETAARRDESGETLMQAG